MNKILTICLLVVSSQLLAQNKISGYVVSLEDGAPLSGVNVIEKGTENVTATNGDGYFELTTPASQPTLIFSFIGLKTVVLTVTGTAPLKVEMELDAYALSVCSVTCSVARSTAIGYQGGARYTPVGVKIVNETPRLFNIPLQLRTTFSYSTDLDDNKTLNASIKRYNQIGSFHFNLGADYSEGKIFSSEDQWEFKEVNIFSEIRVYQFYLIAGFGKQEFRTGDLQRINNGAQLGLRKFISPLNLTISSTGKYWKEYWQGEFEIVKQIMSRVDIGAKAVLIDTYRELELTARYRFNY